MLKVRLLLSVLFTNIFVLNSQYIKILINLDNSYLDSVEVTEDYRLDYYDNQYYLSNSINYLLLNGSDFKLIEYNDYAYLFYNSDDKYNLSIYNLSLKEISKTVIIESNITSSVVLNGNGVNLLYNYNDDIYLKTFGETIKEKKFEGELKEEVLDCVYYDNYYYMVVKKDKLTGGDFGYGGSDGCKVILKLDSDFNVIKYNTINLTNDFYKLEISNGLLYLVFDNKTIEDEQIINNKDIYLFDLDFNYINKHYNISRTS